MLRLALCALLLFSPAYSMMPSGSDAPAHPRFPAVTADTLSKQTLHLPADFGGGPTLVFVAFERDQQKDVNTWSAAEAQFAKSHAPLRYYEIPVLPPRDALYRWWLNTAMRTGTPDDGSRARTVPVYTDKARFKRDLQISTEKTISVLLLDGAGQVEWRTTGAWTEEKQRAMLYALDHH